MKPLLDALDANCKLLAENSLVFHDAQLLKAMLESELEDPDKQKIFKSCLYRGIAVILANQNQNDDYLSFIARNGLLDQLQENLNQV